ncbi:LuxR family transcriptional regulator [Dokdonella soli]|uniref:LuxR family transcriptional regulator n=1 Tax=Dokdonella soli TaxID=529810 RepID=UPI0031D9E166
MGTLHGNDRLLPVDHALALGAGTLAEPRHALTLIDIDHLESLRDCTTSDLLASAVDRLSHALGFDYWMYALDLPVMDDRKRQYMLGGYPADWVRHYFASGYLHIDPVIAHCQAHATPFLWPSSQRASVRCTDRRSTSVDCMFQEASEFGLKSGLSIPIHGLGCSWGLVSFASSTDMTADDVRTMTPQLHLLAHGIHEAGHRYAHDAALPPLPHLTDRELECLHWVAAGKTSWEIGRLLGVAERTVVFHLQNATRKLGVSGRQAAIARSIVLGLINP